MTTKQESKINKEESDLKKILKFIIALISVTVIFSGIPVYAFTFSEEQTPSGYIEEGWTPIHVDIFKLHIPTTEYYPNIYGLRLGLPITYNDSASVLGIDISALFSGNTYTTGLQLSFLIAQAADLDGLQVSVLNFVKEHIYGLQVGGFNHVEEKLCGVQIGGVNYVKEASGLQIGLFNYTEDSQGIFQIGVLNINKNGWLPYSIILNFNF